MDSESVTNKSDSVSDQMLHKIHPGRLSLQDSGLIHLFGELDIEVRKNLIDFLDRMGLINDSGLLVIPATRHYFYDAEDLRGVKTVINLKQLNHIREIKDFLRKITDLLPPGSNFVGCFVDSKAQRGFSDKYSNMPPKTPEKAEIYENGIESRIPFINRMYSIIDARTNRYLTKRAVSNLLKEAGLRLNGMTELSGLTYFCTQKVKLTA
jgi:hypothetical protein